MRLPLWTWLLLLLAGPLDDTDQPATRPAGDRLADIPALTLDELERWQRAVIPTADEERWLQIPWLASFGEGLQQGGRDDKPVLLWVMNGHPLGCT
ncbi:MAG: hypothetical protein AB7O52_15540 [Planctomycetota bacterium]